MSVETAPEAIDDSLARCALYGVLASAFRHPASPGHRTFSSESEGLALREAIALVGGARREAMWAAAARLAADRSGEASRMADFIRLFGHTARGVVPPYETEYGTGGPFFQPQELSDIVGFYRAFGLDVDSDKHERLDHIACECEFMCFLCAREAAMLELKDCEDAESVRRAQRVFMRDHLGAFGRTFFSRLSRETVAPWHAAAAVLGSAFLEGEHERLELEWNPHLLTLRAIEEFAVPMACGQCEDGCPDHGG